MSIFIAAALLAGSAPGVLAQEPSSVPAAQPQQVPTQRVKLPPAVAVKLIEKTVKPDYSKDLHKQRIQGLVRFTVTVSKDGDVTDVKQDSGHPALGKIGIDAVKQWKFKPYLLNGQAVEFETPIVINFTLVND